MENSSQGYRTITSSPVVNSTGVFANLRTRSCQRNALPTMLFASGIKVHSGYQISVPLNDLKWQPKWLLWFVHKTLFFLTESAKKDHFTLLWMEVLLKLLINAQENAMNTWLVSFLLLVLLIFTTMEWVSDWTCIVNWQWISKVTLNSNVIL